MNKMEAAGSDRKWKEVITSSSSIWSLNLKEIWNFRDLLRIWMRRDILSIYKQTILGPVWFFIQPILATVTYVIIFTRIGNFSTTGLPPLLFYMSGTILWGYFSECITKTSSFLKDNNPVFSKVYFPRLIIPVSIVLTNLVKFFIQLLLFLLVWIYFYVKDPGKLHPDSHLFLLPLLLLLIAGLGLGSGMIISSLTIRYKDLIHLVTFGVQLMMFLSPVFFPLSSIKEGGYRLFVMANPMAGIIEAFRYGMMGQGYFSWGLLAYDAGCMIGLLLLGVLIFNSIERSFIDTI